MAEAASFVLALAALLASARAEFAVCTEDAGALQIRPTSLIQLREEGYCARLKSDIDRYDARHPQRTTAFVQGNRTLKSARITLDNTDVTIAHYMEDTSWSSALADRGAKIDVRGGEADESAVFLSHIVESYDELGEVSAFLHGAAPTDWHSPSNLLDMVQHVDPGKLLQMGGYASLNLGRYYSESAAIGKQAELFSYRMDCEWKDDLWTKKLRSANGILAEGAFTSFAGYCCSQFVAHRDAIRRFPKEFYVSLLKRLKAPPVYVHDSYKSKGRDMEYLWHVIFAGGPAVESMYDSSMFTSVD